MMKENVIEEKETTKESGSESKSEMLTGAVEEVSRLQKIVGWLICWFVLVFSAIFLFGGKREYSENENRSLAQMPVFSAESIRSGEFTSGLEKYVSDQFPKRDDFLTVMTEAERLSGRREINDVYLSARGFLIKAYDRPQNTERIITQFRKLAENVSDCGVNVRLMLVPTSVTVYRDHLPAYAPDLVAQETVYGETQSPAVSSDAVTQQQTIDRIYNETGDLAQCVDVAKRMEAAAAETDALYYRTDHHWTAYGAYIGYLAYCEAAGLHARSFADYDSVIVSEDFRGTTYARLNDPHFGTDSILACTDPEQKLTVVYEDTGEVSESLFNPEYLTQRDQYSYFLNNIHPLVTITNDAVEEGALVLVKDSYANSLLPFLVSDYHTIYVFDTRYYRGGPSSFIREHTDITDVLILYNMNTIDSDTGIGGIY